MKAKNCAAQLSPKTACMTVAGSWPKNSHLSISWSSGSFISV